MFVINFIILKTFILNIILLLLGEFLAMSFLNQSKIKTKPIMTSSRLFSCALHWPPVIAPSSDWFIVLTVCVGFGQVIIILLWFWFYKTQLKTRLRQCYMHVVTIMVCWYVLCSTIPFCCSLIAVFG